MGIQPFFLLRRGTAGAAARGHEEYIAELRRQGNMAAAGAVEGDAEVIGLVILQRMDDAEARRLMDDDPAVKSGALRVEYHHWWCAAHVLPDLPG